MKITCFGRFVSLALVIAAGDTRVSARTFGYGSAYGNTIHVDSTFDGYQTLVNRDLTGGQPAYDYSVHIIKTGEDTGQRHRAFVGGRWKSIYGDGDHTMQWSSGNGAPNTWAMWVNQPELWQGQEDGHPGQWFSNNYLEPEVIGAPGVWLMYSQVEIDPGQPIDLPGQVAWSGGGADRIMLATSGDCKNWTRKEDRGVVINISSPTSTALHHEEMIYAPWDPQGKPYWMYVFVNVNNTPTGHWRIRSSDYTTFDFNAKEATTGIAQLGNQIGYLRPGGTGVPTLYSRITFTTVGSRTVPAIQYSSDALNWSAPEVSILEGSSDNVNNKNCYFLGMASLNGTGEIEYIGNNQWRALIGATTCNSPVAPDIFNSEIGSGLVTITIPTPEGYTKTWEFTKDAEGWGGPHSITSLGYVSGGYLGGTINGPDPYCFSPDNLGAPISNNKKIRIRMKNSTSATDGQIFFSTVASPGIDAVKQKSFTMIANDPNFTTYTVDMSTVSAWTGTLRLMRLDPGSASSGSFRVDYIHVGQ